jgi:hypothetical protein
MSYTPYITKEGDTWTGISFKAYGTITRAKDIIDANPYVGCMPLLTDNILLRIPIQDQVTINKQNLPPWKR